MPIYPTEQQRADVRNNVINTASDMFRQLGIRNVTMDDIAHRLTMSKRTLYQLFADKEELLLACCQQHDQEACEHLGEMVKSFDNVLEFLLTMFSVKLKELNETTPTFWCDIKKYPRVVEYIDQQKRKQESDAVEFLQKGIAQGVFREDVNFQIVVYQLNAGMDTMVSSSFLEKFSQVEVFFNTLIPYIRGCSTHKGIDMIDEFLVQHRLADKSTLETKM